MPVLPKGVGTTALALHRSSGPIRVSPRLVEAAEADAEGVYRQLETSANGLSEEETVRRREQHGPNVIVSEAHYRLLRLLAHAVVNPLVILLVTLAMISFLTAESGSDIAGGVVMLVMVALGVSLRFFQEARADAAAAKLRAMIRVTATVVRDGRAREVSLEELVPGDVVQLSAGDMIPADLRLVTCKDLHVIQASLTGESFPVEKSDARETLANRSPLELKNVCYLGTSVESGSARGVLVATGLHSYLGSMATAIVGQNVQTSFDRGVSRFTWLMIRFIIVMAPLVFLINGLTKPDAFELTDGALESLRSAGMPAEIATKLDSLKGAEQVRNNFVRQLSEKLNEDELRAWQDRILKETRKNRWWQAFMFAIAIAVGLTPEMLPMIVSVCLSRGAMLMSRKRVIVKRLNSIQNLGAMDVLCTDKTGTLTMDRVILERYCDVIRKEDPDILTTAYLNSYFQTGLKNLMDRAILEHEEVHARLNLPEHEKVDEIPFDFQRKVMSVVVKTATGGHRLICKGAPEEVFKRCSRFELEGALYPIERVLLQDLMEEYDDLSREGFRVLALAYRDMDPRPAYTKEDESDLVLKGYLAFLDPPKDSAAPAILALQQHGVSVKVLTGDNDLVSRKICSEVGLDVTQVLLGGEVEKMTDAELAEAAGSTVLFARLSPSHKQRIIKALQSKEHVVGFLGDGINDSPALRAADVGISVDTAVDIAKESADAILLEKSLMVLEEGVVEGRKVFANILKYIRMGASSNFGNMFSVLGASVFLPFLPMEPIQILTNNLLYDFSQVPIPTDNVDPEQIGRPRPWSIGQITRFILFIGPCSSIFDYTTFFIMLYVFNAWDNKGLFQTGWFVESLITQTLIIHIIRTNRIPFLQSSASGALAMTSIAIILVGVGLTFIPFIQAALGFKQLPWLYWPLLLVTLICYVLLTQMVKTWLLRRSWIDSGSATNGN
jgi:magnesium-transporting ATPase (P-type)